MRGRMGGMPASRLRISLRLSLLLTALISTALASLKIRHDGDKLQLQGQVAMAQWERDAINLEIARQHNMMLQLNGEDEQLWVTGSHNPEWDLIRRDEIDRLNARLKKVDNFLSSH